MRKQPTRAEARLWRLLRHKQLNARFRRQAPVGHYILDFYCPQAKLAIELDGGGHADEQQRKRDDRRDRDLAEMGIRLLRIWNPELMSKPQAVLELIWACVHEGLPVPARRLRVDLD